MFWFFVFILLIVVYVYFPRTQKSLKGQICLITGGGSGIGRLMAHLFSKEGCKVVLWDVNKQGLDNVAKEIEQTNGIAYTYVVDVSDRNAIFTAAQTVKREVGKVDILVNNAGVVCGAYFLDTKDENSERVIRINTLGVMWCTKAFLQDMVRDNSGHIVTISSAASLYGTCKLVDYVASKWAAFGFAEALRLELRQLKKDGVQTTVVCPYYINTGMFDGVKSPFPLFPILDPNYVATQIVHAVKTNQKELYLPRALLSVYLLRFFPLSIRDWIDDNIVKVSASMDDFKGQRAIVLCDIILCYILFFSLY